jgi:hypothetical protein
VIGQASRHCWCNPQRLVDSGKIVIDSVDSDHRNVIVLENPFVSRVKRRIPILIVRL